jgi:hypothetical protein
MIKNSKNNNSNSSNSSSNKSASKALSPKRKNTLLIKNPSLPNSVPVSHGSDSLYSYKKGIQSFMERINLEESEKIKILKN